MKELKCKNCGAQLRSDGVCEYCGSIYEISKDPTVMPVLIHEPRAITLEACYKVPFCAREYLNEEEMAEMVVKELAHKIAKYIPIHMCIDYNYDIENMSMIYRGWIRIIPPSFKF